MRFTKGMTPWNKGKKFSQKSREKMRIAHLGQKGWNTGSNLQKRELSCVKCGKNFIAFVSEIKLGRKFCSKSCASKVGRLGKKHSVEAKEKISKANFARFENKENHPKWIADRTKIKVGDRSLNDPLQKGWREAVKSRDGWKCRIADNNCSGKLEAHHILPWSKFPELRHEVNNGITLCHAHHPRKHDDVAKLSPYFQSLVASLD